MSNNMDSKTMSQVQPNQTYPLIWSFMKMRTLFKNIVLFMAYWSGIWAPRILQHFLTFELNPCNHLYMGKFNSCKSSSKSLNTVRQRFVSSPIYENIVDNLNFHKHFCMFICWVNRYKRAISTTNIWWSSNADPCNWVQGVTEWYKGQP